MRLILTICLLFVIAHTVLAQVVPPKPGYENVTITVTGIITDGLTNKPIPGAVVRIDAVNTGTSAVVNTDNEYSTIKITAQDGSFEIPHIPFNNQYNITITAMGYSNSTRTISFDEPREEESGRKSSVSK